MTHSEQAVALSLELYQVNYEIGLPLLVAARTSCEAASHAKAHYQNGVERRPMLIEDVTEEFCELSIRSCNQTLKFLSEGRGGVVAFDQEEGWWLVA